MAVVGLLISILTEINKVEIKKFIQLNISVVTGLNPANQIAKPLVNTNVVTTPIRNAPEGSVVRTQPVKDIKPVEKPETKAIVPTPKKEETQAVIAPNLKSLKDSILASTKSKDKSPSQEKIVKPETEKAEPSTQIVEERKSPVVENKELVEKPKEAMVEELPSPHSPQDQKPTAAKSNGDTPVESQDGAQENEDILERKDSSQASPPQELQLETQEGKASEHAVDDFDVVEVNPSPNKIDEEKPSPVNDAEVEKIIAQEAEGSKKIKLSEDNDTISLKSNKSKDSDKLSKASSLSKSQLKFYEKEGEKIKQALSELEELVNSVEKKIPNNYKKVIDFAQRVNKKRSFKERLASLMNFFEKS